MTPEPNRNIYFELKGKSLDAARRLETRLRQAVNSIDPGKPVKLETFYKDLMQTLEEESPESLELVGLKKPSIQIFRTDREFPRAYEVFPAIFLSPEKNPRYFLAAPADYKGEFFHPLDSRQLNGNRAEYARHLLYLGATPGGNLLFPPQRNGVETPSGLTPLPATGTLGNHFNDNARSAPSLCFAAGGRSRDILHEISQRDKIFHSALEKLRSSVDEALNISVVPILKNFSGSENLHVGTSYSYPVAGGRPSIELHISHQGQPRIMRAGDMALLANNPCFAFSAAQHGRYAIHPRTDTPEGQKILPLFNALPEKPGLAQYPELHMPAPGSSPLLPHARLIGDLPILIYTGGEAGNSSFCPPGSIPISIALYEWINEDQSDREAGILPPPMPEPLKAELSSLPAKMRNSPGRLPGCDAS